MAPPTPAQLRTRERVERVIGVLAPALDLLLAAGDRVSRVVERDGGQYRSPQLLDGPPSRGGRS
jgi:hypothetical protein